MNSLGQGVNEYLHHQSVDWWGLVALGTVTAVFIFILLFFGRRGEKPKQKSYESTEQLPIPQIEQCPSQLVIHSAVWGPIKQTGIAGMLDEDVADKLRTLPHNGLVVLASNSLFGDHTQNQRKRLKVVYSYGNSDKVTIEREEDEIMVLPEDPHWKIQIEQITNQVAVTNSKLDDLKTKSTPSSTIAGQARAQAYDNKFNGILGVVNIGEHSPFDYSSNEINSTVGITNLPKGAGLKPVYDLVREAIKAKQSAVPSPQEEKQPSPTPPSPKP